VHKLNFNLGALILQNKKNASLKRGFTLIELLVVVLIIGVLTVIALPQYQYVVYKARYTQLITLCESAFQAEQRYKLATGEYTTDFTQLDVSMPEGTMAADKSKITYKNFSIRLYTGESIVIGYLNAGELYYYRYYNGRKDCRCAVTDEEKCKVCEKLGAVYNHTAGSQNMYYF